MTRSWCVTVLLIAVAAFAAEVAPDENVKALVEGRLPDDPALPLVQKNCVLCHSVDYVTQQRLTEAQWRSEVEKMRKFGSPANDDETKSMIAYLARYWTPDLPPPRFTRAPAPRGSSVSK